MISYLNRVPACAGFLVLLGVPAWADAIDGAWCSDKGQRYAIEGSSITTTRGAKLTGAYTRHTFAFTLPASEENAGATVDMVLQGEMRVRVRIGGGEPQMWHRCPPGISQRRLSPGSPRRPA
jgi:hypothetical protein